PKDDSGAYDCGLLTENMLLSARALGLGTCVLGSTARFMSSEPGVSEYVKRLDIPEGYKIQVIVAIGYPDESPAAKPRNEDVIRFVD
ncbi:MAG: nitroreductase family protein, partial [Muribaculaceae bacterium]|nr:nitroreductase family protein [Muribaculaceae bacterium]